MGENTATSTGGTTSLKTSDFVHLHNHTHHSVLDGLTKINELAEKVKEYGMMLGDNKSNAIRLPFRVDVQAADLTGQLTELLGNESVVIK